MLNRIKVNTKLTTEKVSITECEAASHIKAGPATYFKEFLDKEKKNG
jgi:hypothetical protein